MTVWAEGSSRYTDESRYRTIAAREFVRRVRHAVTRQETSFTWLLGAGCSVSSGIPTAAEMVRGWVKELKYLETGEEGDVESWAAKRFVRYDAQDPSAIYGEALQALFHTEQDRRREFERLMRAAEPGFGYATLAQLMTHEKWGPRNSVTVSVNFDDLAADALHLYSQRRPQVFTHETLNRRTPIASGGPTIVKIHGDAHLPPSAEPGNRPSLNPEVRERLRELMSEAGLILVGYGGRDESVTDLMQGLPVGAPAGGVYWVNDTPPPGELGEWLEARNAVWVKHCDFDELMYFFRLEFGLGHPKIERFERILRKYEAQYRELSTRAGLGLTGTPEEMGEVSLDGAVRHVDFAPGPGVKSRRETEESRRERLRQSLTAFSRAVQTPDPAGGAVEALAGDARDPFSGVDGLSDGEERFQELDEDSFEDGGSDVEPGRAQPKHDVSRGAAPDVNALLDAAVIELHGIGRVGRRGRRGAPKSGESNLVEAPSFGGVSAREVGSEADLAPTEGASTLDLRPHDRAGAERSAALPAGLSREVEDEYASDGYESVGRAAGDRDDAFAAGAFGAGDDEAEYDEVDEDGRAAGGADGSTASVAEVLARLGEDVELSIPSPRPEERRAPTRPPAASLEALDAPEDGGPGELRQVTSLLGRMSQRPDRKKWPTRGRANRSMERRRGLPPEPVGLLSVEEASAGDLAFSAALERAPKDPALRARYARFLAIGVRDLGRAEEQYERAQQLAPDNLPIVRDYARFALEQLRDTPRAERLLTKALNVDLRNDETLRALAQFLLRARGDLDEAENCFRLAMEVKPGNPRNLVTYARFLDERRGRRDAAEAHLRRAAEIKPYSAAALAELALFRALRAQNFDAAEQMLAEATRIGPDEVEVLYAQAVLCERKGELDDAEGFYRKAVQLDPREARAQLAFARFLRLRRADLEAADQQHRDAIAAAPDFGEPLTAYATFLEEALGDVAAAEARHRQALELEPYNPTVLAAFAQHLGKRDDMLDEADALFRDALALSPRSSEILRVYGRFLEMARGDAKTAETYLRRAVEFDPQGVDALDDLAQFLFRVRNDAEEAEVYFREALRLAPDRAETLTRFAGFLRETRRDLGEAVRVYRKALERNPKDAATLSRAAQFLLAEGRKQEGLKLLNDAFDAAWSMDPAVRPNWLMLELWIYRYAHDPSRRDESLKAALMLIDSGARSDGWDLGPTIERAIQSGHPDAEMLRDLARVATDGGDPRILERRSA